MFLTSNTSYVRPHERTYGLDGCSLLSLCLCLVTMLSASIQSNSVSFVRSDATGETPGMVIYSSDRLVIVRITLFVGSIGMNMR